MAARGNPLAADFFVARIVPAGGLGLAPGASKPDEQ
jgi:hypothetical protein